MKLNPGWKEVFGAIGICVSISLVILAIVSLVGCAGTSVAIKVNHDSSAQDVHDMCENNLIGPDLRFPIGKGDSPYRPELTFGLGWDVRGRPCQGRDPVGNASFRFPIWVK
jgi:hypothetical protein